MDHSRRAGPDIVLERDSPTCDFAGSGRKKGLLPARETSHQTQRRGTDYAVYGKRRDCCFDGHAPENGWGRPLIAFKRSFGAGPGRSQSRRPGASFFRTQENGPDHEAPAWAAEKLGFTASRNSGIGARLRGQSTKTAREGIMPFHPVQIINYRVAIWTGSRCEWLDGLIEP